MAWKPFFGFSWLSQSSTSRSNPGIGSDLARGNPENGNLPFWYRFGPLLAPLGLPFGAVYHPVNMIVGSVFLHPCRVSLAASRHG